MEANYGPVKLKVPKGFPVLLQRFAREVIREQPDDIVEFGANFFQTLVIERKVTGEDPLECDPYDKPGFHAPPKVLRPVSSKVRQEEIKQEKAAIKIQAGYREYQVRKTSVKRQKSQEARRREEEAAVKIQAHYRGFQTRKSISQPSSTYGVPSDAHEQAIPVHDDKKAEEQKQEVVSPVQIVNEATDEIEMDDNDERKPEPQTVTPDLSDQAEDKSINDDVKSEDTAEQEAAAVKIQAAFRGHKSRKELQENKVPDQKEAPKTYSKEEEEAAVKIQATFRGHKSRKQRQTKEDQKDAPEAYNKEEEQAAVKIQATFRGHQTRKNLKDQETTEDKKEATEAYSKEEEQAAMKIQATFRGHQTRKNLKDQKTTEMKTVDPGNLNETQEEELATEEDFKQTDNHEKEEAAAVKIQATFRGHKARQQLNRNYNGRPIIEISSPVEEIQVQTEESQRKSEEGDIETHGTGRDADDTAGVENVHEKDQAEDVEESVIVKPDPGYSDPPSQTEAPKQEETLAADEVPEKNDDTTEMAELLKDKGSADDKAAEPEKEEQKEQLQKDDEDHVDSPQNDDSSAGDHGQKSVEEASDSAIQDGGYGDVGELLIKESPIPDSSHKPEGDSSAHGGDNEQ